MKYWIWLTQIKGIGPVLQKRLLDCFKEPENIYNSSEEELLLVDGIGISLSKNITESRCLNLSESILQDVHSKGIKLLTIHDSLYPDTAKGCKESPILLYYRGTIKENIRGIAVVGARRCSSYGKQVTVDASSFLANNDIAVISGMAKGIDSYAHIACIKEGGYTIAFLGHGVDICYPKEHTKLMEAIIENGVVISEYPPTTQARPENFPKRNALISSWSDKVLVVEAGEKSGALITAEIAKTQGKEVLVPPHEIYSSTGKGTNELIRKGANIYLSSEHLLIRDVVSKNGETIVSNEMNNTYEKEKEFISTERLNSTEILIIESLIDSVKTINEISKEVGMDEVLLLEFLSTLELQDAITSLPGGRYSCNVNGSFILNSNKCI